MSKQAFNVTIVIDRPADMPAAHEGDITNLLMHRNFEVTDIITRPGMPIVTVQETQPNALSTKD